jgi:hypothetical protein
MKPIETALDFKDAIETPSELPPFVCGQAFVETSMLVRKGNDKWRQMNGSKLQFRMLRGVRAVRVPLESK